MAVVFRSGPTACGRAAELCGVEVSDNELQQGQGIHGSLGRADTRNMMAAAGPDFRRGFARRGACGLRRLGAHPRAHPGPFAWTGRERSGAACSPKRSRVAAPASASGPKRLVSAPAANGFRTVLDLDVVRGGPSYARGSPARSPVMIPALTALLLAAAAPEALRLNQIQVVGTHNSYHAGLTAPAAARLQARDPQAAAALDYRASVADLPAGRRRAAAGAGRLRRTAREAATPHPQAAAPARSAALRSSGRHATVPASRSCTCRTSTT